MGKNSALPPMRPYSSWRIRSLQRQNATTGMSPQDIAKEAEQAILRQNLVLPASKPWMQDTTWGPCRIMIGKLVMSKATEIALLCIISMNLGLILYETNEEAKCYPDFQGRVDDCPHASRNSNFISCANTILLIIYSIEAAASMFVLRFDYFKNNANLFDLLICLAGWTVTLAGSFLRISWIRVLRCARILRTVRFVYSIPECYMLFAGFFGSMKALFFGSIVLACLLVLWSIVVVQIIHPINASLSYAQCSQCAKGFQSIGESMLTLFQQIVAGDSWGTISVPVIKESPWGMILPIIQLVIGVGAMNLILAVVVDRAVEARENNREQIAAMKSELQKARKLALLQLVREFDTDRSGTIDRDEILQALESSKEFQERLQSVGLSEDELVEIFDALEDTTFDGHGAGYLKICSAFDEIEAADIRKTVVLTKLRTAHFQRKVFRHLHKQDVLLETLCRLFSKLSPTSPQDFAPVRPSQTKNSTCSTLTYASALTFTSDKSPSSHASAHNAPHDIVAGLHPSRVEADNETGVFVPTFRGASNQTREEGFGTWSEGKSASIECSVTSFQSQLEDETTRLRQCLAQLEHCWSDALHGMVASGGGDTMIPFCNDVLHKFGQRRSRLIQDLLRDIEDDAAFLARQLTSLYAHTQGQDSTGTSLNGVRHTQLRISGSRSVTFSPKSPRSPGSLDVPIDDHLNATRCLPESATKPLFPQCDMQLGAGSGEPPKDVEV